MLDRDELRALGLNVNIRTGIVDLIFLLYSIQIRKIT
jgi:hypothetical protein